MKNVLITGVSSGIGLATAKHFISNKVHVFGSLRKAQDVERLQQELPTGFTPLLFDITDTAAVDAALQTLTEKLSGEGLDAVINNAGVAVFGPMEYLDLNAYREQLEINLIAPISIAQKCIPLLKPKKGKIIMVSSTAGKFTRPLLGPYSSSKHALEAVCDAWRREMRFIHKMDVVLIQPGPIKTSIWNKAKASENLYAQTEYGKIVDGLNEAVANIEHIAIPAEKVAQTIWKAFLAKKSKSRYLVAPKKFMFWLAMYVLPDWILDRILIKELKKINA